MNKYFKIAVLLSVIACYSCTDWLNVSPKSEKTEEDLFSTEAGFKSALTGAYIYTAAKELYGSNTTLILPESFTHHWATKSSLHVPTSSDPVIYHYYLSQYEYDNTYVEGFLKTVWSKYYNCILQLNNIIKHLEDTDVGFRFGNDKLIEGEAYGLRAFLHLDILRFFGPVPIDVEETVTAIPYVEQVSRDPNNSVSISYSDVLEKILRDLNRAESLLKESDPVLSYPLSNLRTVGGSGSNRPDDEWQWNRQLRFNYYAVLATKARYYLWTGDKVNAAKYAAMVADEVESDGKLKFPLADELYYQAAASFNPHVFPVEFIFGVNNPTHYTQVIDPMITLAGGQINGSRTLLMQDKDATDIAYESGINGNDIRYRSNRYWKLLGGDNANVFIKYGGPQEADPLNYIPLIRVAEMYLILLECLPIAEAKKYFEEYRIARNMDISTQNNLDADTRMERVEMEYRKEFYGEGQMFHYYKRLGTTRYEWPYEVVLQRDYYVIPKPLGQSMFE